MYFNIVYRISLPQVVNVSISVNQNFASKVGRYSRLEQPQTRPANHLAMIVRILYHLVVSYLATRRRPETPKCVSFPMGRKRRGKFRSTGDH